MDINKLKNILLGTWSKERNEARRLLNNSFFHYQSGLTHHQHRELVLEQLMRLRDSKVPFKAFPKEFGGRDNFGGHIAAFEELIVGDPSLQIKAGVQYGLFTAAIQHLGTEIHHKKYLEDALNLKMLGSYGMTESGHGSDVFNIKTTATFDEETDEFIINTPDRSAWKDYLGNAAKHGKWAVVFAQLYTKGINHGVHAFLVPIRNNKGNFYPGVTGEDNGVKGGLNGLDNGRLCFSNVRIPRENLLNRYGSVDEEGNYTSLISNPKRRFFVMLGTLVQGRVSLDGAAVVASKVALQIAITYANKRRQFPNESGKENLLLDYPSHQNRLLPLLAETYASNFAHEKLLVEFDKVFTQLSKSEGDETKGMQDLELNAAALKASNTWHALNTLQQSREACGGNGFLQENHLVQLKSDFDVYVTFEGDNTVLNQMVAKRLISDYGLKIKKSKNIDKLHTVSQPLLDKAKFKFMDLNHISTLNQILQTRVETLTWEIANDFNTAKKNKLSKEKVFFKNQTKMLLLAEAYADLLKFEAFRHQVKSLPHDKDKNSLLSSEWKPLNELLRLYGLSLVLRNASWYMEELLLTSSQSKEFRIMYEKLLSELRPYAQSFVDAFGYKKQHLRAKIVN